MTPAPLISTELGALLFCAVVVLFAVLWVRSQSTTTWFSFPHAKFLEQDDNKKKRHQFTLIDKITVSHDVVRFRLGLPNKSMTLGLAPGKHIQIFAPNPPGCVPGEWNGRPDREAGDAEIMRKYTPTTSDSDAVGFVDLVLKVYRRKGTATALPQFPDGGKMSQYLESLPMGSPVTVKGPVGLHEYKGLGVFKDASKEVRAKHIGLIAGGTGITPMLQIMKAVLENPRDTSTLHLLYANQGLDDILVRDYLEEYRKKWPDRVNLWYTLEKCPDHWTENSFSDGIGRAEGRVSAKMMGDALPAPGPDTVVLCCGPPPMIEYACKPFLEQIGHAKDKVIIF